MAYPISNVYRRVQYTGSAGVGPYSFSFEILSNTDISVFKNETLLTLTTNYTVTINANGTGSVTLVSAATGSDTITIYGSRAIERTSDFVTGGDLFANTLNDELDSLVIFTQQNKEEISRALLAPVTDPTTIDLTLPGKDDRAGYVLSFNDTTGDPEVTTTVADINQASTYAANALASQNAAAVSAAAALVSQGAAATSASAASASASAAAASVNGGMYSAVQDKNSNYTVVLDDAGDLIRVNTSAGVVTITLPTIGSGGITDGFKVAVVKWTNDANSVSVVRSGSNTINGANTYSIGSQYTSATFVADAETGQWFGAASGVGTANIVSDVFSGTGSQTSYTLSGDPGSKNNTFVYVGGVYQQKSTYTQTGSNITFSAAPPSGSSNIEIIWIQPQAIGVPSDGSVSSAKLAATQLTLPNAVNEAATVTIASASTVDIGAAAANTITISGTTTITAFGTIASGAVRRLVFAGALTLTHNATSLILPGSANITTAAGDVAEFLSLGSGNWRCINYSKASGTSVASSYSGPSSTRYTTAGSHTFTIPSGITQIKVTVVGGGGGSYYEAGCTGYNGGTGGTSSVASGTQTISTISATGGGGGAATQSNGGLGSGGDLNARGGGTAGLAVGGASSLSSGLSYTGSGLLGSGGVWIGYRAGGGGGTATKWLTGLTAGNTLSVTVGAGGTSSAGYPGGAGAVIFEY